MERCNSEGEKRWRRLQTSVADGFRVGRPTLFAFVVFAIWSADGLLMFLFGWCFLLLMVADGTSCKNGLARSSTPARDNMFLGMFGDCHSPPAPRPPPTN